MSDVSLSCPHHRTRTLLPVSTHLFPPPLSCSMPRSACAPAHVHCPACRTFRMACATLGAHELARRLATSVLSHKRWARVLLASLRRILFWRLSNSSELPVAAKGCRLTACVSGWTKRRQAGSPPCTPASGPVPECPDVSPRMLRQRTAGVARLRGHGIALKFEAP